MLWPSEADRGGLEMGRIARGGEMMEGETEEGERKKIRLMERRRRGGTKRGELQSYMIQELRDDLT